MRALVRAGATNEASTVLASALAAGEAARDDRLLVRALTAWNVPTPWTYRPYGVVDTARVAIIDRLLHTAPLDAQGRGRLLCSFVRETSYSDDPRTEPAAREALEIAHATGDPELVALALMAQAEVYLADVHPAEWGRICTELSAHAERHHLVVFELLAHVLHVRSAFARLDLDAARAHLDSARRMARTYQLRQAMVVTVMIEAMLAHLTGDPDRAEHLYRSAHAAQRRANAVDADEQLTFALLTLRYTQGRLSEVETQLRALYEARLPAAGAGLALALVDLGRHAEAAAVLREPEPPLALDYLWLIFMTLRGLAVAEVGDRRSAEQMYATLLPYAGQVAGGGTSGFVLTPVARALGHLARSLGRRAEASAHFERARAVAARCGSAAWLTQIDADEARLAGTVVSGPLR
jgi:hypothetical protein